MHLKKNTRKKQKQKKTSFKKLIFKCTDLNLHL